MKDVVHIGIENEAERDATLDDEGVISVEYLVLTTLFGLVVAASIVALGPPLLEFYHYVQLIWSAPFP